MTTTTNNQEKAETLGSYTRLFITAALVFFLDQVTKAWIFNNEDLPLGSYHYPDSIQVIPNFFYIVHIGNEGAAWGLFAGHGGLLSLFALVALFAIYKFRHELELHRGLMQIAFGLLVGGIVGNLVDRQVHGHVIDFLDFHFPFSIPWIMPTGRYPSFNIADCGIVIGVFTYTILSFVYARPQSGESN
jgi:signal peptidase II